MKLSDLISNTYFRKNFWEFLLILEDTLWISKTDVYTKDITIPDKTLNKIYEKYDKFTKSKIPIEYILWYTYFYWEKFFVNENVLIPRPETEYLVKYVLEKNKNYDIIFDIWTWSGVIWITLAKITWKKTILSDISKNALSIAKKNANNICKNCNLEFVNADLWNFINNYDWNKIVSANLPYIDESYSLDEYSKHEPYIALFSNDKWLFLYKNLLSQLEIWTMFAFEMTYEQAENIVKNFKLKADIFDTCHNNIKILIWKKI